MIDITWGPEILVGGVRPAWLGDDVPISFRYSARGVFSILTDWRASRVTWNDKYAIRLPADHFAYVAISKGYTPWGGGDAAPYDWDGGEVLLRNSRIVSLPSNSAWQRGYKGDPELYADIDVIGYRKRTETPTDTVTLAVMSNSSFHAELIRLNMNVMEWMNHVGLIHEETTAERFTRETGHKVTPGVEAALNWEREK